MAKYACEDQTSEHGHSTSISGPGYTCLSFPTEPGLLLELIIILGNRAVRDSGSKQEPTAKALWPRDCGFHAPRSSRGQLSSSLVCVQQLGVHGGQDLCPVSSQTRRSQDHWLTLRSHLGPIKILFLSFLWACVDTWGTMPSFSGCQAVQSCRL